MTDGNYKDYGFQDDEPSHMHRHFMPKIFALAGHLRPGTKVLDVGCGNGFTCGEFLKLGCEVTGVDLGQQGIELARRRYPAARFEILAADDQLPAKLGANSFDYVVSTEVVEHLYAPRQWARGCYDVLKPGGTLICTTPYHGYLKNLLISLLNSWDRHANPLWDGGHIKLWSRRTLMLLLAEAGFDSFKFRGAGRMPGLWMTMVMAAHKPDVKKNGA